MARESSLLPRLITSGLGADPALEQAKVDPVKVRAPNLSRASSQRGMSNDIYEILHFLYPERYLDLAHCMDLVHRAYSFADANYGIASALKWAQDKGWQGIPPEAIAEDVLAFERADFSLYHLAKSRMDQLAPHRLSKDKVAQSISPNNPELDLLLSLAGGIHVMVDPDFVPNGQGNWPTLSNTFKKTAPAVEAMIHDSHQAGLGFYLPSGIVRQHVEGAHLNRASHAMADKPQGRGITDCSAGRPPLNSDYVKSESDRRYGVIEHPTIGDMVRMVFDFVDQETSDGKPVAWDDLVLFKVDLKGAYTLLSFQPEDVRLMGLELSDGVTYFSLGGHFGWTGLPAAFQVVTRALVWELSHNPSFLGRILMYVDDLLGVCPLCDLARCLDMVKSLIRKLLGSDAVAENKTVTGRSVTVIGYTMDLDAGLVTISERNHFRALYAFLSVDLAAPVPVRAMQKLSSLASRYGKICRSLRPLTRFLYRSFAGHFYESTVCLDPSAQLVIRLFRALLIIGLIEADDPSLSRHSRLMTSFLRNGIAHVIDFDASLDGVGLLFSSVVHGREVPIASAQIDISSLGFNEDSSFQNSAEFIAAVFAGRGAFHLRWNGPVLYRGDSMSALSWVTKERVKSNAASPAGVIFSFQCSCYAFQGISTSHVPGVENVLADSRSRKGSLADLGPIWASKPELDLQPAHLLPLLSPTIDLTSNDSFWSFLKDAQREVSRFLNTPGFGQ